MEKTVKPHARDQVFSDGKNTVGDFVTYTALGWVYKTGVEVIMLPVTYRVIAYVKRNEPTYGAVV